MTPRQIRTLHVFSAALLLTSTLTAQKPAERNFDALVTLAQSKMKEYGVPGVAIGIVYTPAFVRVIRAAVLEVMGSPFIESERSLGSKDLRMNAITAATGMDASSALIFCRTAVRTADGGSAVRITRCMARTEFWACGR